MGRITTLVYVNQCGNWPYKRNPNNLISLRNNEIIYPAEIPQVPPLAYVNQINHLASKRRQNECFGLREPVNQGSELSRQRGPKYRIGSRKPM